MGKPIMGKPIIDDELWKLFGPLLPPPKSRRKKNPGRLPVSNRAALTGIRGAFLKLGCCLICWNIRQRTEESLRNRLLETALST